MIWKVKRLPRRFLILLGSAAAALVLLIVCLCVFTGGGIKNVNINKPGGVKSLATDPTVTLPPRAAKLLVPQVTPEAGIRDLSFGAVTIHFTKEKQINTPSVFGGELFFSAGTGQVNKEEIFKKLFIYNMETGDVQQVSTPAIIKKGGYYQTQVNKDWLVWLETDHGINNTIYAKNRNTDDAPFKIASTKSGEYKLRLAGNTLIYVEPTSTSYNLMMVDLISKEPVILNTIADKTEYGVSAPCIYEAPENSGAPDSSASPTPSPSPTPTPTPTPTPSPTSKATATGSPGATGSADVSEEEPEPTAEYKENTTIVWAGPDPNQTAEQKAQEEHSAIFWLKLGPDAVNADGTINKKTYLPGTYVHEPKYNGKYVTWIDNNYAPGANLYLSELNGQPKLIDSSVTNYAIGDNVLVYGKLSEIWVYVISSGEYCCMTGGTEKGKTPCVYGNTVVWNDWDTDEIHFKVLTDEELASYSRATGTN